MKLIDRKKKIVNYEKVISQEMIDKYLTKTNRCKTLTVLLCSATAIYAKFDNIVYDGSLTLKQNILDNIGLMTAKFGQEPLVFSVATALILFSLMHYSVCNYNVKVRSAVNKNLQDGNLKKISKSVLRKLDLKKKLEKVGYMTFGALGYLATTKNIAFDPGNLNLMSIVSDNVCWALQGIVNEPVISAVFALPTIGLFSLARKDTFKHGALVLQNKFIEYMEKENSVTNNKNKVNNEDYNLLFD